MKLIALACILQSLPSDEWDRVLEDLENARGTETYSLGSVTVSYDEIYKAIRTEKGRRDIPMVLDTPDTEFPELSAIDSLILNSASIYLLSQMYKLYSAMPSYIPENRKELAEKYGYLAMCANIRRNTCLVKRDAIREEKRILREAKKEKK